MDEIILSKQNDQWEETKSCLWCGLVVENVEAFAFLLQEQIDKFEEAADGINADMALAEKALKVGADTTDERLTWFECKLHW